MNEVVFYGNFSYYLSLEALFLSVRLNNKVGGTEQMQQHGKYLKWLAVAASLGMLFILIGGALVTKTDSGLGCGRHWPDCNGSLIPQEITTEVLIEFSHRFITGAVSFFIVALVAWTWKSLGHIREVKFLGLLAIFFLVAQALIGAAQVLWGQGDFILALHCGISLISFSAVLRSISFMRFSLFSIINSPLLKLSNPYGISMS